MYGDGVKVDLCDGAVGVRAPSSSKEWREPVHATIAGLGEAGRHAT